MKYLRQIMDAEEELRRLEAIQAEEQKHSE
jgi:hypothetical protein